MLLKGDWLDVVDSDGIWNVARVLRLPSSDTIKVKYDGWGDEYDEVLPRDSARIAPYGTYTRAVKCWAQLGSWPWWPAIVTIRTPANELGVQNLQLEQRLHVDFLDDDKFKGRCRCWVKKNGVVPRYFTEEARELHMNRTQKKKKKLKVHPSLKAPTQNTLELSEKLLQMSNAGEDFPQFGKGTLPAQYANSLAPSTKVMRKKFGDQKWLGSFTDNRRRHAATHAYTSNSGGKKKSTTPKSGENRSEAAKPTIDTAANENSRKLREKSPSPRLPLSWQNSATDGSGDKTRSPKKAASLTESSPRIPPKPVAKRSPRGLGISVSKPIQTNEKEMNTATQVSSSSDRGRQLRRSTRGRMSPSPSNSDRSSASTAPKQLDGDSAQPFNKAIEVSESVQKEKSTSSTTASETPIQKKDASKRPKQALPARPEENVGRRSKRLKVSHEITDDATIVQNGNERSTPKTAQSIGKAGDTQTPGHGTKRPRFETLKTTTTRSHSPIASSSSDNQQPSREKPHEEKQHSSPKPGTSAPSSNDTVELPDKAPQKAADVHFIEGSSAPRKYGTTAKRIKSTRRTPGSLPLYFSPYATFPDKPLAEPAVTNTIQEIQHPRPKKANKQPAAANQADLGHAIPPQDTDTIAPAVKTRHAPQGSARPHTRVSEKTPASTEATAARTNLMEMLARVTQRGVHISEKLHALEKKLEQKVAEVMEKSAKVEELRKKYAREASKRRIRKRRAECDVLGSSRCKMRSRFLDHMSALRPSVAALNSPQSRRNDSSGLLNSEFSFGDFSTQQISPQSSVLRFGGLWAGSVIGKGDEVLKAKDGDFLDSKTPDLRSFSFSLNDNFSMSQWYQDVYPQSHNF